MDQQTIDMLMLGYPALTQVHTLAGAIHAQRAGRLEEAARLLAMSGRAAFVYAEARQVLAQRLLWTGQAETTRQRMEG